MPVLHSNEYHQYCVGTKFIESGHYRFHSLSGKVLSFTLSNFLKRSASVECITHLRCKVSFLRLIMPSMFVVFSFTAPRLVVASEGISLKLFLPLDSKDVSAKRGV